MTDNINLTTEEQREAFEQAAALVRADAGELCDPDVPDRGPAAGEVPNGEVVRVLAEAYLGTIGGD